MNKRGVLVVILIFSWIFFLIQYTLKMAEIGEIADWPHWKVGAPLLAPLLVVTIFSGKIKRIFGIKVKGKKKVYLKPKSIKEKYRNIQLTAQDRIKLIDEPNLLVVVPLTHRASCKYGHKTAWCTATPSDDLDFEGHLSNDVLIYILFFETKNGKRQGDAKSKVAIRKSFGSDALWTCYDEKDHTMDFSAIQTMLDQDYNFTEIINGYYEKRDKDVDHSPVMMFEFKEGDIVNGVSTSWVKIKCGNYIDLPQNKLSASKKKWIKKQDRKAQQQVKFEINANRIKKAKVLAINTQSVKLHIMEIDEPTPIEKFSLNNYKLTTWIRMGKTPKLSLQEVTLDESPKSTNK